MKIDLQIISKTLNKVNNVYFLRNKKKKLIRFNVKL